MTNNDPPVSGPEAPAGPARDISDLRRLRRQTGISLARISERTGIPHSLLRELEWGLFGGWPDAGYAEPHLRAYAAEAGLDPALVLSIVTPALQEQQNAPDSTAAGRRLASPVRQGAPARTDGWRGTALAALAGLAGAVLLLLVAATWHVLMPGGGRAEVATGAEAAATGAAERPVRIQVETVRPMLTVRDAPAQPGTGGARSAPVAARPPEQDARLAAGAGRGTTGRGVAAPRRSESLAAPASTDRARPGTGRGTAGRFFAGLGRVIAGDGTHQVQPFPEAKPRAPR
jgi:hypothetical protein